MANFIRATIGGALAGGEVWTVNPVFAPLMPPFTADPTQLQAAASAIAAIAPGSGILEGISSVGNLSRIRLEARSLTNELEGVGEATPTTPYAGTSAPRMPPQATVVSSLRTPFPGASNRGRLFWPALALGLDAASARLSATSVSVVATAVTSYLRSVAEALTEEIPGSDTWALAVYSGKNQTVRFVSVLQFGNVVDTQRRRRDRLPETYTSVPWEAP